VCHQSVSSRKLATQGCPEKLGDLASRRLAQLVERGPYKADVIGSSPILPIYSEHTTLNCVLSSWDKISVYTKEGKTALLRG
jgi:hypothetical protein